jgi:hypothetical protein
MAGNVMPSPKAQFFDSNGDPLNAGKVYFYAAGTETPQNTYTTSALSVANANPVILDSRGEASIYLSPLAYKVVLKTSADVTIWTQDNVTGNSLSTDLTSLTTRVATLETYKTALEAIPLTTALSLAKNLQTIRTRFTIGEINAGATLLAANATYKYRMVGATAIAIGGAVGATTTVDIIGTQAAAPVKLAAFAQASLTQSTVLTAGGSGGAVLADGASFVANDLNTAITVGKTGATATTATHIDISFSYVLTV